MNRSAQPRSQTPDSRQFSTTRLDVAAFLLVRGFAVTEVNLDGSTASFAFEDPKRSADSAAKDFYNGGQVPANEYADAQKRVRDLMWEAKRRQTNGRNG